MHFYTGQHRFYCGVDLHARTISSWRAERRKPPDLSGSRRADDGSTADPLDRCLLPPTRARQK